MNERADEALMLIVRNAEYWHGVAAELVARLAGSDDEACLMMEAYEQAEP